MKLYLPRLNKTGFKELVRLYKEFNPKVNTEKWEHFEREIYKLQDSASEILNLRGNTSIEEALKEYASCEVVKYEPYHEVKHLELSISECFDIQIEEEEEEE